MKRLYAACGLLLSLAVAASCKDRTLNLFRTDASEEQGGNMAVGPQSGAAHGGNPSAEGGSLGSAGAGAPAAGEAGARAPDGGSGAGEGGRSEGGSPVAGAAGQDGNFHHPGCTEELCGPDFCEGAVGECVFAAGQLDCSGEVGSTAIALARRRFHVLKIDMARATELRIAARICDPTGYVLHLGDSSTNDGGGGDYATTSNDAEITIHGTRLDVFANDLGAQNGFHPSLLNDSDYVSETGCTTRGLVVGDQLVRDFQVPGFYMESSFFLRIQPAADFEGTPDSFWWLGINHVANAQSPRSGTGLRKLRLCFTERLPRQCELNGYGRDPDAGICASSPAGWEGCGANGCAICPDTLSEYPSYLKNHPCCAPAQACDGAPSACNEYCPAPTAADR